MTCHPTHNRESFFGYSQCHDMNIAFACAMLEARRAGKEKFAIGPIIDTTPFRPTYFARTTRFSCVGSPAANLAEEVPCNIHR